MNLTKRFTTALFVTALAGCSTETPTRAVVANDLREAGDGAPSAQLVVYRVWYSTTYFGDPVLPGAESDEQRIVPGSDTAYAVLASGWEPSSPATARSFVALRSKHALSVARGDVLSIAVSDSTFTGRCDDSSPLTQTQADFITTRIFPGEFAGVHYDAATCTTTSLVDAGQPPPAVEAGVPNDD
ncbi:MAG TPA: hypothetical protein VH062_36980 [Polyangiaceae bacterium]|jgi:hypothetical protein|nr:hypothetical protein [Polyangiaceae bacterium]